MGRAEDAIAVLRQAIAIDPLYERPREALVLSLSAHGRIKEALNEYRDYRTLVHQELDEEPSVELRRLVANLGKNPAQNGESLPGPPQKH